MTRLRFATAILLLAPAHISLAEEADKTAKLAFFENKIRPVLVEHCYGCHSAKAKKIRGELLLDTRAGSRQGGESGPAVVPGDLEESLLLSATRHEAFEMPPDRKLPGEIVADFATWIKQGAVDPRDGEVRVTKRVINIEEGRKFWSFQPLARPTVPEVLGQAWPRDDMDRFVLKRLEAAKIQPVADADRRTLIRRVYFDLIGLPPTPEQIDAFLNDESPEALEHVIDELLRSPRFGERWGRHWLDVVRFAESSGGGRTLLFPEAWRYRDYVIESFNNDLPYDRFVKQQIAGDLMEASDWQEKRRQIVATAFLVLGPTNYELQDKDVLEMDIIDEQLDTMGKAFLGMTIGCARCHDHKFDPIPIRDYYALAGILKSTKSVIHSNVSKWNVAELPMSAEQEAKLKVAETQIASLEKKLKLLQAELKKLGGDAGSGGKPIDPAQLVGVVVDDMQAEKNGTWNNSTSVPGFVGQGYLYSGSNKSSVTFTPKLPRRATYEVRITFTPHGNRAPNARVQIFHEGGESVVKVNQTKPGSIAPSVETVGKYEFDPPNKPRVIISNDGVSTGTVIADAVMFVGDEAKPASVPKQSPDVARKRAALAAQIKDVEKQIKEFQSKNPKRAIAMAVTELEETGDIPIAIRGIVHNKGEIVPRGVLQVTVRGEMPHIAEKQSGRLELADWIANVDNPLTARIMANRVWYWLYGTGLVRTVDNFGATGEQPTHPELLDHLAAKFVADGWSVKKLIRRVVLSRTYQLSSGNPRSAIRNPQSIDPDNRLLSRRSPRRLDAESIRDALLLVGGNLDMKAGGANMKPGTKSEYGYEFASTRRSVYVPVFRNLLPEIFATFDFADPNIQVGLRASSTTSPQALFMMNHPLVMEQSEAAAKKLLAAENLTSTNRIHRAYEQVLGRLPNEREAQLASRFIGDRTDVKRWGLFYQALFQSLDFRFVD